MAEMEFSQSEPDLFEIETNNNVLTAENLPIYLFQEIEADLCDKLLHSSSPENDQTDGPLEFIQTIVDKVKEEFEGVVQDEDRKTFLKILSKIFTILLFYSEVHMFPLFYDIDNNSPKKINPQRKII